MAMKVPVPVTSGAQPLGGEQYVPNQSGFINLSYPTPPMKTFEGDMWAGGQMKQLGAGIMQVGAKLQEHYDAGKLLEIEKDWYDFENQLYDPSSGILSQYGGNSIGISEATNLAIEDFKKSHGYGGMSMAGKRAADRLMAQRGASVMSTARNHERENILKYETEMFQATIEQHTDRAGAAPLTDQGEELFNASIAQITQKVESLGDLMGWSEAKRAEQLQIHTTASVINRVNGIATGTTGQSKDPTSAIEYLQSTFSAGLVDTETYNQAMATLKPAWVAHQAQTAVGAAVDADWNERWGAIYGDSYNPASWQGYDPSQQVHLGTVAGRSSEASARAASQGAVAAQGYSARGAIVGPRGGVATGPSPHLQTGTAQMSMAFQSSGIGGTLSVSSGYRPPQRQAELWDKHIRGWGDAAWEQWQEDRDTLYAQHGAFTGAILLGQKWEDRMRMSGKTRTLAPPGMSNHQRGMAADLVWNGHRLDEELVPQSVRDWVRTNASQFGLHLPMGYEPWHVEVMGTRGGAGPASQMRVSPAAGNKGVVYTPRGVDVGIYGGTKQNGELWQSKLGFAHTGQGNPQHRDYSQLYRIYTFEKQPGYIHVGYRNGRAVYAAPDYLRDPENPNAYLSVAAEDGAHPEWSATHIASKNGWLIPTQSEIEAVRQAAQYKPAMVTSGDMGVKAGTGDPETFTRMQLERLREAGYTPGASVFFAKELGMPDNLAEGTGLAPPPGQPQMNGQWAPGPNFPKGADGNKVGYIMQRLIGAEIGITPEMAAGIIGSLMQESGPALGETLTNSIGAHGIAQWLGPRRKALQAFATSRGTTENDLDTQIDFLLHELQGSESAAFQALLQTRTPEEAAEVWTLKFERPGAHERFIGKRQQWARGVYGEGGMPEPTPYRNVPGQPGGQNPYGMSAGAAMIYNMPRGTADEREIRSQAMQGYQQEQAWISQQQNRQTSELIDGITVEMHNAPAGTAFEDIVTPEVEAQLGAHTTELRKLHQQIQSGAYNTDNHDLHWEWVKMGYDAKAEGRTDEFMQMWEDPAMQTYLRTNLSPEQFADLKGRAETVYADQAAREARVSGQDVPEENAQELGRWSHGQIEGEIGMRLDQLDLDPDEQKKLTGQIALQVAKVGEQLAQDTGVSPTGEVSLSQTVDKFMTSAGIDKMQGPIGQVMAEIDAEYAKEGKTAYDMVEEGFEIAGQPFPQDVLAMIYDGFVIDNRRAPEPSELMGEAFWWATQQGGAAFQPQGWAGRPVPMSELGRYRGQPAVPYAQTQLQEGGNSTFAGGFLGKVQGDVSEFKEDVAERGFLGAIFGGPQ